MNAYKVRVGKRGDQIATLFILESPDYKNAIIRAMEKFADINQCKIDDCALSDIELIEPVPDVENLSSK